eukprot:TRINITY_DN1500_c0_g1_i2.p2 TRINITY_DN1500_c0_g1~~TRINITY_DN1500_c0_g1_i2.p2  ORF type:complete len:194 (-),score=30.85 TRINITY_DN1500_c0_g1_i2:152-733(-)
MGQHMSRKQLNFCRQFKLSERTEPSHAVAVIHGDLWLNNLLFTTNTSADYTITNHHLHSPDCQDEDVTLIDWQFAGWANPLADVRFLLYTGLAPDMLVANERDLLGFYHEQLCTQLTLRSTHNSATTSADAYPMSSCLADYRRAAPIVYFQLVNSVCTFLPENNEPLKERLRHQYVHAMSLLQRAMTTASDYL